MFGRISSELKSVVQINKFKIKINSKIAIKNNSIKSFSHFLSNNFSKNGKNNGVQRYIIKRIPC